jgi:D-alanyl-D-alanine carboxypeptidase
VGSHRVRADRSRNIARTSALAALLLVLAGTYLVAQRHREPVAPLGVGVSTGSTGGGPDSTGGGPTSRSEDDARQAAPFDRTAHSTTDPASPWVVVNKTHPISPIDFRPELAIVRGYQVAVPAAGPLTDLLDASDRAGLGLKIASAFRSYAYQVHVHDALVASEGSAAADRVSARAGYSEHQTGLAVDLSTPADPGCDLEQCFGTTPAGRWLSQHAWEFGFLVRYTAGNEAVTGYAPEPWHLRFVGKPLARAMHDAGVSTLEQFLGVPGGGYP